MKSVALMASLLAASGLLCACASEEPPPGARLKGPPLPGLEHGPGPQIFISPAGEPFRPQASGPAPLRRWFDQADANHDGVLTAAEFQADQMRFFAIADANRDGIITPPEVSRYEAEIAPEILAANERPDLQVRREEPIPGDVARIPGGRRGGSEMGGPDGPGVRSGPGIVRGGGFIGQNRQGAARYSLLNEPQPLRAADLDYDFRVTSAEWIAASARRFAQLDTSGTGKIAFADLRLPNAPREGRGLRRKR